MNPVTLRFSTRPEIVIVIVASIAMAALHTHEKRFSSVRWRTASLETQTRVRMTPALLQSQQLLGMTREQVINLLGPPTDTDKFRDWDMVYVLGPQSDYMDYQWLVLRLNTSGRVQEQHEVND